MEDNAVDPLPCPNEGGCTQWACAADPSTSLDIAVDALPCSNEGGSLSVPCHWPLNSCMFARLVGHILPLIQNILAVLNVCSSLNPLLSCLSYHLPIAEAVREYSRGGFTKAAERGRFGPVAGWTSVDSTL